MKLFHKIFLSVQTPNCEHFSIIETQNNYKNMVKKDYKYSDKDFSYENMKT